MKKIIFFTIILAFLTMSCEVFSQVDFHKGVNLTEWFQASGVGQIQFTKYTKKDFENIQSLGCNVIRLPINLHYMTNGAPGYVIEPLFFEFLDSAVNWAEELNIYLILDNHTFDPAVNTAPDVGNILVKVWIQMAQHYKDRSNYIIYEILNEPHGISNALWGTTQKRVIDTIRLVDTKHAIVVGGADWNTYNNLKNLPSYSDTNLIYTFHFYDPFMFTHQGAGWTNPKLDSLSGVPFPYKADSMPQCPAVLKGTWIENEIKTNYKYHGTVAYVDSLIDIAVQFKNARKVRVFCGEFGAYRLNSNNADRAYWYDSVRNYFDKNKIPWTIWDYQGGFGLFYKGSNELFDYDLNIPLLNALGLNVPPQQIYELLPDSIGFPIYDDYIEENIFESSNPMSGTIDHYSQSGPNNGKYCLYWKIGNQYSQVGFDFKPDKDLSKLVENNYALDFMARGLTPGLSLDIRFLDTKTSDPDDHPWRIIYTVSDNLITWDGRWHHVYIPLKNFTEQGSWDNSQWYNPLGKFDWKAIDRFEISAEMSALQGHKFWFDNIFVSNMDTAVVTDTSVFHDGIFALKTDDNQFFAVYPNPVKTYTVINYNLVMDDYVEICIYNALGKRITNLIDKKQRKGTYALLWIGNDDSGVRVQSGIYICTMSASYIHHTRKIIVL